MRRCCCDRIKAQAQTCSIQSAGTDTARIVGAWALDIPHDKLEHANRYETVAPEVFYASLNELEIRHEEFVFIDIGSGKGRALLLASRFPFKEIIGVELSAGLNTVANRNLRAFKDESQKCFRIQSIGQDALDYELPPENIVFYLYNPFDEQRDALGGIEDRRFPSPLLHLSVCALPAAAPQEYLGTIGIFPNAQDNGPLRDLSKQTPRLVAWPTSSS